MIRGYIGQGNENMGRKSQTKCTGTQRHVSAPHPLHRQLILLSTFPDRVMNGKVRNMVSNDTEIVG
jgi:hypothetical protein